MAEARAARPLGELGECGRLTAACVRVYVCVCVCEVLSVRGRWHYSMVWPSEFRSQGPFETSNETSFVWE